MIKEIFAKLIGVWLASVLLLALFAGPVYLLLWLVGGRLPGSDVLLFSFVAIGINALHNTLVSQQRR